MNYKKKIKEIQDEVFGILEEKIEKFDSLSAEEQIHIDIMLNKLKQKQDDDLLKSYKNLLNIKNLNSEHLNFLKEHKDSIIKHLNKYEEYELCENLMKKIQE